MFWSYLRRILSRLLSPLRSLIYSPGRLFRAAKKPSGVSISLPARIALAVAIFLVLVVAVVFVAYRFYEYATVPELFRGPRGWVLIAVLLVAIPIVVYNLVKLWLEGEASPYGDIEWAWSQGVAELARHGLDLSEIPLFLVLGSQDEAREKTLFEGSGQAFDFEAFPQGIHPIHWYANREAIYVACTSVGVLGALCKIAEKSPEARALAGPDEFSSAPSAGGGTLDMDRETFFSQQAKRPEPRPASPPVSTDTISGEAIPDDPASLTGAQAAEPSAPLQIPGTTKALEQSRLRFLCHLIRRERAPVCPINGVLLVLPFQLIQRDVKGDVMQEGVRRDAETLFESLELRFPLTVLVSGMEQEPGFLELARRVGPEAAENRRFGKGFDVKIPPMAERLEALAAHACGAFEAKIYSLFKNIDSLRKATGNKMLYCLLCKTRGEFLSRLKTVVADGLGDWEGQNGLEPLFVVGCYFAAAGDKREERQAFVRSVFERAKEAEAQIQWSRAALARDARYRRLAQWFAAVDLFLAAGLAALVGWLVYQRF